MSRGAAAQQGDSPGAELMAGPVVSWGSAAVRVSGLKRLDGGGHPIARVQWSFLPKRAGGGYGSFSRDADSLEIPPKDLPGLVTILQGRIPEWSTVVKRPNTTPRRLKLVRQGGDGAALYCKWQGPRYQIGTGIDAYDAWRWLLIVRDVLMHETGGHIDGDELVKSITRVALGFQQPAA